MHAYKHEEAELTITTKYYTASVVNFYIFDISSATAAHNFTKPYREEVLNVLYHFSHVHQSANMNVKL